MKLIIFWTLCEANGAGTVDKKTGNTKFSFKRTRLCERLPETARPEEEIKKLYDTYGSLGLAASSKRGDIAPKRYAEIHSHRLIQDYDRAPLEGWLAEEQGLFAPEDEKAFTNEKPKNGRKNWD